MKRISTIAALFAFLMSGSLVVAEEQIEKKEKDSGIYYRIAAGITADARLNRIVRGDLIIEAVANEVGYEDASFFGRLFRRQVGLTPAQYRKRFGALRKALQAGSIGRIHRSDE